MQLLAGLRPAVCERMLTPTTLMQVLVLLFAIVTPLVAWDGPAQPLAPGTNVHLLSTPAGNLSLAVIVQKHAPGD